MSTLCETVKETCVGKGNFRLSKREWKERGNTDSSAFSSHGSHRVDVYKGVADQNCRNRSPDTDISLETQRTNIGRQASPFGITHPLQVVFCAWTETKVSPNKTINNIWDNS